MMHLGYASLSYSSLSFLDRERQHGLPITLLFIKPAIAFNIRCNPQKPEAFDIGGVKVSENDMNKVSSS